MPYQSKVLQLRIMRIKGSLTINNDSIGSIWQNINRSEPTITNIVFDG